MRRHLLMITKVPEFDERGEVVLGQCEPFTSGWDLILIAPDRTRELLLAGTYTDLHKILESCHGLQTSEAVKKRVEEMRALQNTSVTETVAVELSRGEQRAEPSSVLEPTVTGEMPAPPREALQPGPDDGFFETRTETGVLVALVASPDRAGDVSDLKTHLLRLLNPKPRAIILDLSRVGNLASRAANELLIFRDQCAEMKVPFGLCGLRQSVRRLFEKLEMKNPPPFFENPQVACAEILTASPNRPN